MSEASRNRRNARRFTAQPQSGVRQMVEGMTGLTARPSPSSGWMERQIDELLAQEQRELAEARIMGNGITEITRVQDLFRTQVRQFTPDRDVFRGEFLSYLHRWCPKHEKTLVRVLEAQETASCASGVLVKVSVVSLVQRDKRIAFWDSRSCPDCLLADKRELDADYLIERKMEMLHKERLKDMKVPDGLSLAVAVQDKGVSVPNVQQCLLSVENRQIRSRPEQYGTPRDIWMVRVAEWQAERSKRCTLRNGHPGPCRYHPKEAAWWADYRAKNGS